MSGPALHRVRTALGSRVATVSPGHIDARCPSHDDHAPSLSIDERDGAVYLHCHAGCTSKAIVEALGLSMRDLFDQERHSARGEGSAELIAEYDYTDESGVLLYQKRRFFPKQFQLRYPAGSGWIYRASDVPGGVRWVLFRLPALRNAIERGERVFIVEGEKDVLRLEALGFAATCNTHGASKDGLRPKWSAREATFLAGAGEVVVFPDNDDAGRAHARAIATSLSALPLPPVVRIVSLPGLPEHGDVSDWLDTHGTPTDLFRLIDQTVPTGVSDTMLPADSGPPSAAVRPPLRRLRIVRAADVPPEQVEWLWPGWLPFGKLVSVDGNAGLGKSTLVVDWIARASRGGPMPYMDHGIESVPVLIAGVEDGWADTIRPRLDAAGANLNAVHFVSAPSSERGFTIPHDVTELMQHAAAVGARWLHIDAIMGVLHESVSANSDHEVRRALGSLKDAASEAGLLVTFVRHPRKSGGLAVHAGGGSVAFTALSRVGLMVGGHPDDRELPPEGQRRVVAVAKSNLARYPKPLAFTVESGLNGAGFIAYHGEASVSADQLANATPAPVRAPEDAESERPRGRAVDFLNDLLRSGARIAVDEIKVRAREAGLAWRTVERAAGDLGVTKERTGYQGPSVWYLPTREAIADASPATQSSVPPVPPPFSMYDCGGGNEDRGVTERSTPPSVRVTMTTGDVVDLPADSPDLTDLRHLIAHIEPLGSHPFASLDHPNHLDALEPAA